MGYFREFRTTQERRRNLGDACDHRNDSDESVPPRARRKSHLPNAWDDIFRNPFSRRSWKYYRGKQYRKIADMNACKDSQN